MSVLKVAGNIAARNKSVFRYDALGRLAGVSSSPAPESELPPSSSSQPSSPLSTAYTYTLQGWESGRSASLGGAGVFAESLGYDVPATGMFVPADGGGSSDETPSYTGKISGRTESWSVPVGASQSLTLMRTELYAYDYAGRLSSWDDSSRGEDIVYDARGNITSVVGRHSSGAGNLSMTYSGDRIVSVLHEDMSGSAGVFVHDAFGRVTSDPEEGVEISYNPFDLPESVSAGSVVRARYAYTSDGTKLSAEGQGGEGLVYRGPFVYRKSSSQDLVFESAPFSQGRLTAEGVRYHITDHLGSVRAVVSGESCLAAAGSGDGQAPMFYSASNYEPYGAKVASPAEGLLTFLPTGSTVSLRDGFTGKEEQTPDFGLGYLDFGARHYSPALRRWLTPDPLSEKYYGISPYAYCGNDPVNNIDLDGLLSSPIYSIYGELLGTDENGLQGDAIIMLKDDFYQGMPSYESQKHNLGIRSLVDENALRKFNDSYDNLSSRPDWDGYLTFIEAREWYRKGQGKPLYVSSEKISLSSLSIKEKGYYNLFTLKQVYKTVFTVSDEGLVYGYLYVTPLSGDKAILGNKQTGYLDTYDFDMKEVREDMSKKEKFNTRLRNTFTKLGKIVNGKGMGYNIYTYGTARFL